MPNAREGLPKKARLDKNPNRVGRLNEIRAGLKRAYNTINPSDAGQIDSLFAILRTNGISEVQILTILEQVNAEHEAMPKGEKQIEQHKPNELQEPRSMPPIQARVAYRLIYLLVQFVAYIESSISAGTLTSETADTLKSNIGVVELGLLFDHSGFQRSRPDLF